MTKEEFSELAAAFALGALSAEERALFERTLAEHPEWTEVVDQDLATATAIAATAPEEAPREQVRESVLSRLDALIDAGERPSALRDSPTPAAAAPTQASSPELPDDGADEPPRRRRLGTWVLASVAGVALIVGVGAGLFNALQGDRPEGEVALEQVVAAPDAQTASTPVSDGGEAALTWSLAEGKAVLVTDGLAPAPSGHTYELWFVRGDERIPAGTFDPDAEGEAAVLVAGEMHEGDVVAVTVEVTGGSPDGLPSDQLVFAIPTSPPDETP